jgi:hypothetical protein
VFPGTYRKVVVDGNICAITMGNQLVCWGQYDTEVPP